jgi:hypothetical protein
MYSDESRKARLRRELRNPSRLTVIIIVAMTLGVPLAMLLPSWVSTFQESLERRQRGEEFRDRGLVSANVLVPSQIAPWMLNEIDRMEGADSPASWKATDFKKGPCDEANLSQLPAGQYSDAVAASCADLHDIQTEYARNCISVATCAIPEVALKQLETVRDELLVAFSDAGFVLPYSDEEQSSGQ